MSARGFPKCFPGSRPAIHVGNVDTNTHTCKHKRHFAQTNVWWERKKERGKERERERDWSATVLSDWRWQAGRVTGSCTCKPAPWIYLFDFASSVHRSLRVRATVFNCWPQDPLPTPPPPPPPMPAASSSSSLREYKLWKESLFICLFPPLLPLKWCMEVTHRHGGENRERGGGGGRRERSCVYPLVPCS